VPIGNTLRAEADALSIVAQPSTATFDLPGMERLRRQFRAGLVHESTVFPGFLLLGGLAGLLFLRSALRWPLLFTSLILWALALGTSVKLDGRFLVQSGSSQPVIFMPYAALLHVPGLASLRSPNRVGFTVTAVLAAGTALSLAWLFSRFRGRLRRTAMAAAAGCLMLPNLMIPIHGNGLASPELERALITVAERGRPGEAMIDVPADCRGQTHDVVFQVLHRTPMVGCQTSTAVIPWRSGLALYGRSAAYAALRCDPSRIGKKPTPFTQKERFDRSDVVALQEEMGVRFYLIDLRAAGRCPRLREALATLRSLPVIGGGRRYIVVDAGSVADPTDPGQASAP
jgi:hypothetical protein